MPTCSWAVKASRFPSTPRPHSGKSSLPCPCPWRCYRPPGQNVASVGCEAGEQGPFA